MKTIKHHLDHLRVLDTEQVAQWPYHTLTDNISHLHSAHTHTETLQNQQSTRAQIDGLAA